MQVVGAAAHGCAAVWVGTQFMGVDGVDGSAKWGWGQGRLA
jgi:hypothetical protein